MKIESASFKFNVLTLKAHNFVSSFIFAVRYLCSDTVLEYLVNVTTAPDFRPWEISDISPRIKIDRAIADQSPQTGTTIHLHTI